MSAPYRLTRGAEADLREIARFTRRQWGAAQCRLYIHELERAAIALAQDSFPSKSMDKLLPGLRMGVSGRDRIFFLHHAHAPVLILAILHERMDLITRLRARLDEA